MATPPRPTARGWQALVVGGLLLAGALALGTTQLYQLAYVMLALLVVSFALGLYAGRSLKARRRLGEEGYLVAGEARRVVVELANEARFSSGPLEVLDHLPRRRHLGEVALGRGERTSFEAPVSFMRRGVHEIGPLEVRSRAPFGLWVFTREPGSREEVMVYPRIRDLRELVLRETGEESEGRSAFNRRGEEFSGLREYRRGDELRRVHWKSLARTGDLYVREHSSGSPLRHSVILDLSTATPRRDVERAVSLAASAVALLRERGLPFRLVCAGWRTPFGAGDEAFHAAMRALATVEAAPEALIEVVEDELHGGRGRLGEAVVLVGTALDAAAVERLRREGLHVVALPTHIEDVRLLEEAGAGVYLTDEIAGRRPA